MSIMYTMYIFKCVTLHAHIEGEVSVALILGFRTVSEIDSEFNPAQSWTSPGQPPVHGGF